MCPQIVTLHFGSCIQIHFVVSFQSRERRAAAAGREERWRGQDSPNWIPRETRKLGEIEAAAGDEWRGGRQKIIVGIRLLAVGGRERKREIRGV